MKFFFKKKEKIDNPNRTRRKSFIFLAGLFGLVLLSCSMFVGDFPWNGNFISWLRAREHYDLGVRYAERYYLKDAEARFLTAKSTFPSDWRILEKLGETQMKLNMPSEAEQNFRQSSQLNKKSVKLRLDLCDSLIAQNKLQDAEKTAREAVSLDPLDSTSLAYLALINQTLGNPLEAKKNYEATRNLEKPSGRYWYISGKYHLLANEIQLAESELRQAASIDRTNAEYWETIGKLLFENGKFEDAEKYLKRATLLNKFNPDYWKALADLEFQQEELSRSEDAYKRQTELAPNDPKAWASLGLVRNLQSKFAQAEGPFNKALKLNPNDKVALNGFFDALYSQKKYSEAGAILEERLLKLQEYNNTQSWLVLSAIRIETAEYDKAKLALMEVKSRGGTEEEMESYNKLSNYLNKKLLETKINGQKSEKESTK